jgi:hypothetical protein
MSPDQNRDKDEIQTASHNRDDRIGVSPGTGAGRTPVHAPEVPHAPIMQNFYAVTVQTDDGTRVASFNGFAEAIAAYENSRINGALSPAVDHLPITVIRAATVCLE